MTARFTRIALIVSVCTALLMVSEPSRLEARGRRLRCIPPYICVPEADNKICPQYVWMNHGSYYSYYALGCPSHQPQNYDTTVSATYQGCSTECPNLLRPDDAIYSNGYGAPHEGVAISVDDGELPHADISNLSFDNYQSAIILFDHYPANGGPKQQMYAQIFSVQIVPKKPITATPWLQAHRGLQIQPPKVPTDSKKPVIVYDLRKTSTNSENNPYGLSIEPKEHYPHCYIVTCPEGSPFGNCTIPVVTHHGASSSHAKK